MPSGGARPNSGRPKGSKNQKTKLSEALMLAAAEAGEMPLPFFLRLMRDETLPASMRFAAGELALPFCSPRLASTEVSGPGGKDLTPILNVQIIRYADKDGLISAGPPLIEHE